MKKIWTIIISILIILVLCIGGFYFYNIYSSKNIKRVGLGESFSIGKDRKISLLDNNNLLVVEFKGVQAIGGGSGIYVYFNGDEIPLDHCPNKSLGPKACDYNMKILSDYGYDLKNISVDRDQNILTSKIVKTN